MLKRGDILMFKGNKFTPNLFVRVINGLISYLQDESITGDYTHSAICIDADTFLYVQVEPPCIKFKKLDIQEFIESEIEYFEVAGTTDADRNRACEYAISKINTPYDLIALTGIGYTDYRHALYCTRLTCLAYPTLWARFKNDKQISPNELINCELLIKKGNLSREQLPDWWLTK